MKADDLFHTVGLLLNLMKKVMKKEKFVTKGKWNDVHLQDLLTDKMT